MNFSWLSLIGGGVAAAATLSAGISMTGLLAPSTASGDPMAQTIYVEQPIVEVSPIAPGVSTSPLPPRIIAILPPADTAIDASAPETAPAAGGATPDPLVIPPSHAGGGGGGHDDDGDDDGGYDDDGDDDGGGDDD
jgi:hypothetical protein